MHLDVQLTTADWDATPRREQLVPQARQPANDTMIPDDSLTILACVVLDTQLLRRR